MVTVSIAPFKMIGKLQREKLCHSRAAVIAGLDERVDNSCKRRAEYLRRSLVIICRQRGQWQASLIREKSACLLEVSVTDYILREIPNSQKSWEN